MGEKFDWSRADPRERDAEIAVRLFGWRWLRQLGHGGFPDAIALWPPEAPARVLFNLRDDAEDVTAEHWKYQRFSDWDRMGYREEGDSYRAPPKTLPHYTTDPAADYLVLEHVRNKYGRIASKDYDASVWGMFCGACGMGAHYQPGIYSESALAVLREREAVPHD